MRLPSNRQLEAFMAVAEARSFRLASTQLGLSQPALSQNIAQLEAYMGAPLFLRTTRSVRLTAEGMALQLHLGQVLPKLRDGIEQIQRYGKSDTGRLRLGFLASAAVKYLPAALQRFREIYPQVEIAARDDTAAGLFDALRTGQLDLAVTSFLPHEASDVQFELMLADPLLAVVRRDHPLASRTEVTWAELVQYDFIGANPDSGTRFATEAAMRAIGQPARVLMAFNHFSAVWGMIEAGMGVSAAPSISCPAPDHPVLCTLPLVDPVVTRDVGILTSTADGRTSQHTDYFRSCLLQTAARASDGATSG